MRAWLLAGLGDALERKLDLLVQKIAEERQEEFQRYAQELSVVQADIEIMRQELGKIQTEITRSRLHLHEGELLFQKALELFEHRLAEFFGKSVDHPKLRPSREPWKFTQLERQ